MPIRRTYSGDTLTSTVRLEGRGPLSRANVAELRKETDAWGLEALLRSFERSARTVLERAGYKIDIPWRRFRSLVKDEDGEERTAAWIVWRIGLLREAMAGHDPQAVALAAMDVKELVDEARWTEAHGADAAAGRRFREAAEARRTRPHPRRELHEQWLVEVDGLVADGLGPWQAAVAVAARHRANSNTVHDAVRRLRKKRPSDP